MTRARVHAALGWAPLGLSLAAFLIAVIVLTTGWERRLNDEGAAAHLWQLFIVLQLPLIAAFIATADMQRIRAALGRLGVVFAALILAVAPVAIFKL